MICTYKALSITHCPMAPKDGLTNLRMSACNLIQQLTMHESKVSSVWYLSSTTKAPQEGFPCCKHAFYEVHRAQKPHIPSKVLIFVNSSALCALPKTPWTIPPSDLNLVLKSWQQHAKVQNCKQHRRRAHLNGSDHFHHNFSGLCASNQSWLQAVQQGPCN